MKNSSALITRAALIAALYIALTLLFAPISYGPFQFRISESLMLLPILTSAAIPGLFIGCLISNIFGGYGIVDIVGGSIATLIASWLTRKLFFKESGKKCTLRSLLFPIPSVLVNGIIVGGYLFFLTKNLAMTERGAGTLLLSFVFPVAIGELAVVYILGLPLYFALKKTGILVDSQV